MTPYEILNNTLWNRWKELLPNSPGYMAQRIIEDLNKEGYEIVKKEDQE